MSSNEYTAPVATVRDEGPTAIGKSPAPTLCQACRCMSYVTGQGCFICDYGVRENELAAEQRQTY